VDGVVGEAGEAVLSHVPLELTHVQGLKHISFRTF